MSLTDDGVSSLAVRYAMNAISYLYLGKADEATLHQMHAVAALQGAIDRIKDPRCRAQAIAASLLLSLYEVCSGSAALIYTSFTACVGGNTHLFLGTLSKWQDDRLVRTF